MEKSRITPELLSELVNAIDNGRVTGKIVKDYLPNILNGISIKRWIESQDIEVIIDETFLNTLADSIISENPGLIEDLRKNKSVFNRFVGLIMDETKKQSDPNMAVRILREKLSEFFTIKN